MAPQSENQQACDGPLPSRRQQTMYIIRHGDRWDYQHPEWKKTAERKGDPSLSTLGHEQARQVGKHLDRIFVEEGVHADQITLLSSPFLRTVQTANELLAQIKMTKGHAGAETLKIKPEYSVFELDLWEHGYHESLPSMEERKCYFPRLDETYETTFVPDLPEDKDAFFARCDRAMEEISIAHSHQEDGRNRVIIVVTHAACCIGLVKSATGLELQEINAAAPCSIYKLMRENSPHDSNTGWKIDHYSEKDGMNGFTGHMDDIGTKTRPWNNFGNREVDKGWTGPPKE